MRALLALCVVTATACSTTDACKKGTVRLTVELSNGAENADDVDITLAVGALASTTKASAHQPGLATETIEVDFASYPAGQELTFTLVARLDGHVLATSSALRVAAGEHCAALTAMLDGNGSDVGVPRDLDDSDGKIVGADLEPFDASTPADLAINKPAGSQCTDDSACSSHTCVFPVCCGTGSPPPSCAPMCEKGGFATYQCSPETNYATCVLAEPEPCVTGMCASPTSCSCESDENCRGVSPDDWCNSAHACATGLSSGTSCSPSSCAIGNCLQCSGRQCPQTGTCP